VLSKGRIYILNGSIVLKNSYLYSALMAAVSISVANAESAPPENNREKCYGIAKAGENDCNGYDNTGEMHSCPSWSNKDNDPYAWAYVLKGECEKKGGKRSPPPPPPKKPEGSE
jgi:uncharacterized membrane protein